MSCIRKARVPPAAADLRLISRFRWHVQVRALSLYLCDLIETTAPNSFRWQLVAMLRIHPQAASPLTRGARISVGDHGILFRHGPRLQVFKLSWQVDCSIIMSGPTGPCGKPIAEGRDRPLPETDRGRPPSGVWPLPVYDRPGFPVRVLKAEYY